MKLPGVTAAEAMEGAKAFAEALSRDGDDEIRDELAEHDLPELADTMEEADARASASVYLRAAGAVSREQLANAAEHRNLMAYYQRKHDERQESLTRQMDYLGAVLEKLFGFMTVPAKKKSLNLLGGRIGTRAQTDELIVEDDEAVIAWAEESGDTLDLVRLTKAVDRKRIRSYMVLCQEDADIPVPPGVELKDRDDVFFATPATD